MEVSHRSCAPTTQKTPSPRQVQLNLSSLITSCIDGTFPVQGTGRRSTSDLENALTMLHASRELHRRNAALALSWRIMGTVFARALANRRKNWEVSLDHLPPTSAARTTSRALPSALRASSGQVISFLRLAVCRATPLWSAALGLADPSPRRDESRVDGPVDCRTR